MSRDRLLPRFIGRTHKSWGTPWVAILIMGVVNAVLINFNFTALITIDVFLLMFPYVLIFLTVMIMRVGSRTRRGRSACRSRPGCSASGSFFPIAIAIIALFVNGSDYLIGGLVGRPHRPDRLPVFKNIYKGTTDEALEGSTITRTGELTEFGAKWKEPEHEGSEDGQLAAIAGIVAGASRSAAGSTPTRPRRSFGIPQFFGIYSEYLSACTCWSASASS